MKRKISCLACVVFIGSLLGAVPVYAQLDLEFVNEWYVEGPPAWVAVHEPTGEVFVNINQNHRVVRYSANGDLLLQFGREGENPVGIGVDAQGNSTIAVSINNNHRVVRYSPFGEVAAEWEGVGEPRGIAVDWDGNSVVAVNINQNHRVVKYSLYGEVLGGWAGEGTATAIALDPEGNSVVAVNINQNHRVVKYSPAGEVLASWQVVAGVIETNGITVGPNGEVLVAVNNNHRVVMYSAGGELLGEFGGQGSAPGLFTNPQGIAITRAGLIVIADSGNNRIQMIQWVMP